MASLSDLLVALHSGWLEPSPWSSFLSALRAKTASDYANLVFRRRDAEMNELTAYYDGKAPPEQLSTLYADSFYKIDPLPYHALEAGRIYALPELIAAGRDKSVEFVEHFLRPSGIDYLRIVRVIEPGGYNAWITITRSAQDFGVEVEGLLATVARHFAVALQGFAAIEQARHHRAIYEAAIERLDVGFLTLDTEGRLIDCDAHVSRLLDEAKVLSRGAGGRLIVEDRAAMRTLQAALREFATGTDHGARAVALCEAPRMDMLLVRSGQPAISGARTPVLTAYVHGGSTHAQERTDQLMGMFGLTRTESRLALAISQGHTIKSAASQIGITVETARFYVKRIFEKTGTNRQADLVRRILTSVLVLS